MSRARYKIGDSGFANLAHLIEQGGGAAAVTLVDVIVFNGPSEAQDPALWAHELHHVDQYAGWGVHSFAVQYARNWQGVENPAYDKGNGYWNWRNQQAQSSPPWSNPGTNSGQQYPTYGQFCYTQWGRFGPFPAMPLGSPCWVGTQSGPIFGQAGT